MKTTEHTQAGVSNPGEGFATPPFSLCGYPELSFELLADAAQEAEYLYAEKGFRVQDTAGDIVYISKGAPE